MLREFPRDFSALAEILTFTEEFFESRGLNPDQLQRVQGDEGAGSSNDTGERNRYVRNLVFPS